VTAARERLLAEHVRLLTFTGPAGTGKTRLALAVAAGVETEFTDGVHFVDLAPIRDPMLVASAIAQVLGVRDAGDQPLRQTLLLYVQPRQLLLVLDNFEQVIDAAPLLAELLTASPELKIVVTSRESLHLSWEHEWPVPPLEVPPQTASDRDSIVQSAAVTLLVERVGAYTPGFALTNDDAEVARDICIRLDGLPLAIELAAAAIRVLPLAAIRARLNQRLLLLTGGPRDAPVRHQTLRAAVAWSYGLLSSDEQMMFRALSVFVGGFTLEAAEAVVGPLGVNSQSILDHIRSLVDKSLALPAAATTDTLPRFRMSETICEFALEQLTASAEFELVQQRHAEYFLHLAGEGGLELGDLELRAWLDRLEAEHDNLRAVLRWSEVASDGGETEARLASALWMFWFVRGYFGEGRGWYERILARQQGSTRLPAVYAKVMWSAAFVSWRQGDYESAGQLSERSLASNQGHDVNEVVMASAVQGLVAVHQSQYALAHATLDRGRDLAAHTNSGVGHAWIVGILGVLAYLEGDYPLARRLSTESLAMCRELRQPTSIAMNLDNLGSVARRLGEYPLAQRLHQESLILNQHLGDRAAVAQSLANLGQVAKAVADHEGARARYVAALQIRREIGDRRGVAITCGNLGALARASGEQDVARAWLDESLAAARAVGDKRVLSAALHHLAGLAFERGDLAAAAAGYCESLQVSEQLQDRWGAARALDGGALLLFAQSRRVFDVPDEKYGEEIVAWIVVKHGAAATGDDFRAFCKGQISHYKVPRFWKVVESFPMTVTGKAQKFKMREMAIAELKLERPAAVATA
jgi:predicted ATPase